MTTDNVYWDSDAFLGWLQNEQDKASKCLSTLERAEKGEFLIVTSALTLSEVLWMRGAPKITAEKSVLVRKFFRRSSIRLINVTRSVGEASQDLVWNHGIKPKDAIHVATAIQMNVQALETFDAKLISKSGKVGEPPLVIREPTPSEQGMLDLV